MASLADLALGRRGRVKCLMAKGGMRRRLMDLGFTAGAETECLFAAPGNGMRAYRIRNTQVALRRKDAETVMLEDGDDA